MLGQRGIWHQGWKAVAKHGPISGMSNFDKDRWQLFHTDEDRSEMHDLSDQHLAKVRELVDLWMREAEASNVLPLNDMQVTGKDLPTFMKLMFQVPVPPSGRYVYYPGTSPIPEKMPPTPMRCPSRSSRRSSSRPALKASSSPKDPVSAATRFTSRTARSPMCTTSWESRRCRC